MSELEYLDYISQCLYRLNCLGDIILGVGLAVLFTYMFYTVLKWFSRF